MAECWIVNSSPLISLDRIGLLDILGPLGRDVVIPRGVLDEIARGPAPITPSRLAIHRTVVIPAIDPIVAGWDLGRGESEVLTWATSQRQAWPFWMISPREDVPPALASSPMAHSSSCSKQRRLA